GDNGADLVVHQGEATHVGRRVIRLERALLEGWSSHCNSSFGVGRSRSDRMPAKRFFARSRPSSKRGGLASGWDHSGCSARAAVMDFGTHSATQPFMIDLLCSANSRSLVSSSNIARV